MPIDYLFRGALAFFDFNSNISDVFLIFSPIIFIGPFASYLLINYLTKSRLAGFVGSLVFCYNTYFLAINSVGHEYLTVSAIFSLLALYFFIRAYEERENVFSLISTLFLSLGIFYDYRMVYIVLWVFLIYLLFNIDFPFNLKNEIKKIFRYLFLPGVILFLINLFWILPIFNSGALNDNMFTDRSLFGDNFFNLIRAISLFHPFWDGSAIEWFKVQPIPVYFLFIPILSLLGLFLNRKNKFVIFFGLVGLVGVFLSKQTAVPLTGVYPWLYEHIPGFKGSFREASKFYFLIIISYSVLIAFFVKSLLDLSKRSVISNFFKYCVIGLIAIMFLWNVKPIVSAEMDIFQSREIPEDYAILNKFIKQETDFSRTLFVPNFLFFFDFSNERPFVNFYEKLGNEWRYILDEKDQHPELFSFNSDLDIQKRGQLLFDSKYFENILSLSSIKYVIIPTVPDKIFDFFAYYGNDRNFFIKELDKQKFLKKINIGAGDMVIYQNSNFRPHIYLTNSIESVYEDKSFLPLSFFKKNSSWYIVEDIKIKEPAWLNFSEKYNSNWKLRVGDFDLFGQLFTKNYFLSDEDHYKNNIGFSSYYLNPEKICATNNCIKNSDGSYNISLTLYFKAQSYFYIGLIISITTFFSCLIYLVYNFIKRRKCTKLSF